MSITTHISSILCLLLSITVLAAEPVEIGGVLYDQVDAGIAFKEASRSGQPWEGPKPYRSDSWKTLDEDDVSDLDLRFDD